ncbi:calcium-binding protein [Lyngbya aestuarii]|uniref:calcium-binding protein n=1 Tax=Lyngbya aestuarii TaxID=118322 RepID=UPI00403DB838
MRGETGNDRLWGNNGNDSLDGGNGNDALAGGHGNDSLAGRHGNDRLWGENGNDVLYGGDGNDKLYGGDGNDYLAGGHGNDTLWGNNDNDDLYGDNGNDVLYGNNGNDYLEGGLGNDYLAGGNGNDTLDGSWGSDYLSGGSGIDTAAYNFYSKGITANLYTGKVSFLNSTSSGTLISIENIIGSRGNDFLHGDNGNNYLYGKNGNDYLYGNDGNDVLNGGLGNDYLNGGSGLDVVVHDGRAGGFDISTNSNGAWTVEDTNISDGDEGTDSLTNIDQILFGGDKTRMANGIAKSTVYAIAGVHEDNTETSHSISGGSAKATNFVIDIEGSTGLGLDFDANKLATFINDITLPDQGLEDQRLAANLLLEVAGGAASAIPIFGAIGSTHTAYQQTLLNYGLDLQQVEAQKQAAIKAVNNNSGSWGSITESFRDMVVVEDFQIGVDNLFLPSVPTANNVGYAIKSGTLNADQGVWIEAQIGNENTNLAFIVNNYSNKNPTKFTEEMSNLLKGSRNSTTNLRTQEVTTSFSGAMIGTLNQTPMNINPSSTQQLLRTGTYAGDWINGLELANSNSQGIVGSFELIGEFGDDLIQGNKGDDILWGGFNTTTPTITAFTYEDDGIDMLQGGHGDDILNGGTGNDILDGGGSTYDKNGNFTGAITNDGVDTLAGGLGNDTFVFNTLLTGIDKITDFEILVDKIQIGKVEFGASSTSEFSFDKNNGGLSFNSQQFATLENFANLENFDVSRDIVLV